MSRRRLLIVYPTFTAAVLFSTPLLTSSAFASHGGDGRVEGPYAVEGKVKDASGVFRDQEGDRIRRTWFFSPACAAGPCDTTLYRETQNGSYIRSLLSRRESGRYKGDEEVNGECGSGGEFSVRTTVRVHVERTREDVARKISGTTETEQDGCATGKQHGKIDAKLDVAN